MTYCKRCLLLDVVAVMVDGRQHLRDQDGMPHRLTCDPSRPWRANSGTDARSSKPAQSHEPSPPKR